MYMNTETSLVNTVQVIKDIFNTSLVSKLSTWHTSLHCFSLCLSPPQSWCLLCCSSGTCQTLPTFRAPATRLFLPDSFRCQHKLSLFRKAWPLYLNRCTLSFPAPIHFLHSPSKFIFIIGFTLCFTPIHWMVSYRRVRVELDLLTRILVQCLT